MKKMYDATGFYGIPRGGDVTAFYAGGRSAYRVWPRNEIDMISTPERLPIYVVTDPNGSADGVNCGQDFVIEMHNLGMKECAGALDFETCVDGAFVKGFDSALVAAGYECMLYGSQSTVFNNPRPSGGYWGARWDGIAEIPAGWSAKQYNSTTNYDISVIDDNVKLWNPNAPIQEEEMYNGLLLSTPGLPTPIPVDKGSVTKLILLADNGYMGEQPVKVRIAESHGAAGWKITNVLVDSHAGAYEYVVSDVAACEGFSVTVTESTKVPVGFSVR